MYFIFSFLIVFFFLVREKSKRVINESAVIQTPYKILLMGQSDKTLVFLGAKGVSIKISTECNKSQLVNVLILLYYFQNKV